MTIDVERLRRLPLFDELDFKDLSTIAHHVGEVQLEEGQVLFQEVDPLRDVRDRGGHGRRQR